MSKLSFPALTHSSIFCSISDKLLLPILLILNVWKNLFRSSWNLCIIWYSSRSRIFSFFRNSSFLPKPEFTRNWTFLSKYSQLMPNWRVTTWSTLNSMQLHASRSSWWGRFSLLRNSRYFSLCKAYLASIRVLNTNKQHFSISLHGQSPWREVRLILRQSAVLWGTRTHHSNATTRTQAQNSGRGWMMHQSTAQT